METIKEIDIKTIMDIIEIITIKIETTILTEIITTMDLEIIIDLLMKKV